MLNLEVRSKLNVEEVTDRAIATFKDNEGMAITQISAHMHREQQALDITLTNVENPTEARERLRAITDFARDHSGYRYVRHLVHFDDTGSLGRHLLLDMTYEKPMTVQLRSDKADEITRAFAKSIT